MLSQRLRRLLLLLLQRLLPERRPAASGGGGGGGGIPSGSLLELRPKRLSQLELPGEPTLAYGGGVAPSWAAARAAASGAQAHAQVPSAQSAIGLHQRIVSGDQARIFRRPISVRHCHASEIELLADSRIVALTRSSRQARLADNSARRRRLSLAPDFPMSRRWCAL